MLFGFSETSGFSSKMRLFSGFGGNGKMWNRPEDWKVSWFLVLPLVIHSSTVFVEIHIFLSVVPSLIRSFCLILFFSFRAHVNFTGQYKIFK
jgi:hypothetical protein